MHAFTSYPDLASRDLAGSVISANDELFAPRQNLIMPQHAVHAVNSFGHCFGEITEAARAEMWQRFLALLPGSHRRLLIEDLGGAA